MNILTHPVHTGYQFDLARTGHEFHSLDIPGTGEVFWDLKSRPLAGNYHRLAFADDEGGVKFGLALVHFETGYHCLKRWNLPLIWKEHCVRKPFEVPAEWQERVSRFCFASRAAADAWRMTPNMAHKKRIIGMGMDLQTYGGREDNAAGILAVGQNIRYRGGEKGHGNLMQLARKYPITVVGRGNEGIPGAIGPANDYNELIRHYQSHLVFLNPASHLGMSMLEAMAAGMAVVSFRMTNSEIISNEVNGLLVDSVEEAARALDLLLNDTRFARELGNKARATIAGNFRMENFVLKWNALFEEAAKDHHSNNRMNDWDAFNLAKKPAKERALAELISVRAFNYCRVGYDQRKMAFRPNGRIGLGAGGCELYWDVKVENDGNYLEIYSANSLTCRLKEEPDGSWRGRWVQFEKMPVVISPAPQNA